MNKKVKIIIGAILSIVIIASFAKIFGNETAESEQEVATEAVYVVDETSFTLQENENVKIVLSLNSDKSITGILEDSSNTITNMYGARLSFSYNYEDLNDLKYRNVEKIIVATDESKNENYVCISVPQNSQYALVNGEKIDLYRCQLKDNTTPIDITICAYAYSNKTPSEFYIVDENGNKHLID